MNCEKKLYAKIIILKKRGFIEFATFLSSVKELKQLSCMFTLKISISVSDTFLRIDSSKSGFKDLCVP